MSRPDEQGRLDGRYLFDIMEAEMAEHGVKGVDHRLCDSQNAACFVTSDGSELYAEYFDDGSYILQWRGAA
jgi:hypothetical protein